MDGRDDGRLRNDRFDSLELSIVLLGEDAVMAISRRGGDDSSSRSRTDGGKFGTTSNGGKLKKLVVDGGKTGDGGKISWESFVEMREDFVQSVVSILQTFREEARVQESIILVFDLVVDHCLS